MTAHAGALRRLGACPIHRRSFALVREALGLPPLPPWPETPPQLGILNGAPFPTSSADQATPPSVSRNIRPKCEEGAHPVFSRARHVTQFEGKGAA